MPEWFSFTKLNSPLDCKSDIRITVFDLFAAVVFAIMAHTVNNITLGEFFVSQRMAVKRVLGNGVKVSGDELGKVFRKLVVGQTVSLHGYGN